MRSAAILLYVGFVLADSEALCAQQPTPSLLEVNVSGPIRWEEGCLRGTLDISNHSPGPLFLTSMGPYYDIAVNVSKGDSRSGASIAWVPIGGVTDIIVIDVETLAAGASTHRDFCWPPYVWVVSPRRKTRREIPVRGKLRVRVSYFADPEDVKKYKGTWNNPHPGELPPLWSKTYAEIPCPPNTCKTDCNRAPVVIEGEVRMVPDAFWRWNAQGRKLTDELSKKFPSCAKNKAETP